jgi:DNA-binding response OmpR family regulator
VELAETERRGERAIAEKILIVEDEVELARMLEMELTYEGYQVDKALDGQMGLERRESGALI